MSIEKLYTLLILFDLGLSVYLNPSQFFQYLVLVSKLCNLYNCNLFLVAFGLTLIRVQLFFQISG